MLAGVDFQSVCPKSVHCVLLVVPEALELKGATCQPVPSYTSQPILGHSMGSSNLKYVGMVDPWVQLRTSPLYVQSFLELSYG